LVIKIHLCIFGSPINEIMKKPPIFLFMVITAFIVIISCSKKETTGPPDEGKVVAWAVGTQDTNSVGMILYTDDAGETWERQGTDVLQGVDVINVWAIDQQNAWVVCSGNKIFRTIDGGATWLPVLTPVIPGDPQLSGISILDNNIIWVSGDQGTVYHSFDAGNSWAVFDTSFFHSGMMQGVLAITDQVIYVAGEFNTADGPYGFFARTLNGGITWDSISLPGNYNRHSWIGIAATDLYHVIVYGQSGHYAVTSNGGNTWGTPDSVTRGDINDLVMLSKDALWGTFDYDQIFKTFSGGRTWIEQKSAGPLNQYLVGIDTYYSQTALVVGQASNQIAGKILKTTDGGNTWYLRHACDASLWKVAFAKIQ